MGIHHLTTPSWSGQGEYRLAFYEGQTYGLENTIFFLFFILIVIYMIKKLFFGDKMKPQISRESFNRLIQYQRILPSRIQQQTTTNDEEQIKQSDDLTDERSSDSNGNDFPIYKKDLIIKKYSFCQKLFNFFILLFMWSLGACIAYLFSLSSGFGQVELGSSIICCLMMFMIILYFTYQIGVKSYFLLIFALLAVAISIFPLIFFQDICVCSNKDSGYLINDNMYLSTSFTRRISFKKACPEEELCHLYATLPENTHNSVFINIHTGIAINQITIQLQDLEVKSDPIVQTGQINSSIDLDSNGERNTFTNLFENLQPNRLYLIKVINQEKQSVLKVTKYKTLPTNDQIQTKQLQVNLAFGGDWSNQKYGNLLNLRLVDTQPDVILFGGNIAQDNGMKNCYHQWDIFLNNFETQIFQALDRVVPFIFSVGNRDIGLNSLKNYNMTIIDESGPLIFSWFPQSTLNNQIPSISSRPSYHYHLIGNIILFALDSGYIMNYDGVQLEWMKTIANKYKDYYKVALYHYPIFPACLFDDKKWDSPNSSAVGENIWAPIFDQYNFVAAIENHTKQFKRTYPIKNKIKSQGGTVYFGDGNWGSVSEDCFKSSNNYQIFEKLITTGIQHFWTATVQSDKIIYDALSKDPKYYLEKDYTQNLTQYNLKQ
ncbi:hypothetical protein ABPG74_011661 [Tetrahymena malaccensis]